MPSPLSASQLLDQQFLDIRAKLIELAAAFDRLGRADGSISSDPRMKRLREAVALLTEDDQQLAERLQMLFSLPYDPQWKIRFAAR